MWKSFYLTKMKTICFTPLNLLILIISDSCLTITDCADSGRERDMNEYTRQPKSAKRLRSVREVTTTSGAVAGAGSSSRQKYNWTSGLDNDILTDYYNGLRDAILDWNTVYESLSARHPNIPPSAVTHDRVHKLLSKIIQTTPAYGEGNILWSSGMKSEVTRIYYQTINEDETKHAYEMYRKWKFEDSNFPDISPMDLLHQAENMLIRNNLLKPSKPLTEERKKKIYADRDFKFDSRKKEVFSKVCMEIPPDQPIRIERLYNELCKEDPRFYGTSPQKLSKRAWYLMRDRKMQRWKSQDRVNKETDSLNQSEQEGHHPSDRSIFVQEYPLAHPQRYHHYADEVGSSSSHGESGHDHLDLDLRLGPLTSGTPEKRHPHRDLEHDAQQIHQPDVDLELTLSSYKKKEKSIQKQ